MLRRFFSMHDPMPRAFTSTQYRSAIFYHDETQLAAARTIAAEACEASSLAKNTAIEKAGPFYRAEEYHQRFLAKQTGRWSGISPPVSP